MEKEMGKEFVTKQGLANIEKLLSEINISKTDYADKCKINRVSFSNYIHGKTPINTEVLKKMCQDFNVRKEYILGYDNFRNDSEMLSALSKKENAFINNRISYYKDFGINIIVSPKLSYDLILGKINVPVEYPCFKICHKGKVLKECNKDEMIKLMRQLDSFTKCAIDSLILNKI